MRATAAFLGFVFVFAFAAPPVLAVELSPADDDFPAVTPLLSDHAVAWPSRDGFQGIYPHVSCFGNFPAENSFAIPSLPYQSLAIQNPLLVPTSVYAPCNGGLFGLTGMPLILTVTPLFGHSGFRSLPVFRTAPSGLFPTASRFSMRAGPLIRVDAPALRFSAPRSMVREKILIRDRATQRR